MASSGSSSASTGGASTCRAADYVGFPVTQEPIGGHDHAMREASVTDLAHRNALIVVDALAAAARRIATDERLRFKLRAVTPG